MGDTMKRSSFLKALLAIPSALLALKPQPRASTEPVMAVEGDVYVSDFGTLWIDKTTRISKEEIANRALTAYVTEPAPLSLSVNARENLCTDPA